MYAIFATVKIKPEFADQFREATLLDAEGSVRDEAACVRFDILQSATDPNVFHLYEVYTDQSAHTEVHRQTPHYVKWRDTVKDWFDGQPHVVTMKTVFPSDDGWLTQKPHLVNW